MQVNPIVMDYHNKVPLNINTQIFSIHGPTQLKYQLYFDGRAIDEDEKSRILSGKITRISEPADKESKKRKKTYYLSTEHKGKGHESGGKDSHLET